METADPRFKLKNSHLLDTAYDFKDVDAEMEMLNHMDASINRFIKDGRNKIHKTIDERAGYNSN